MNKQAVTFLTLFSLILVLSIYYIMIPPVSNEKNVSSTISTIEKLQNQLDKKRENLISKNNEIIAKETSTSESISKALETINTTKDLGEKEKDIAKKIKSIGYTKVFVEIDSKTIKITVPKKDHNKADASKIIKEILAMVGDDYQVEVKFINE